jgi:hypothetical protein
MRLDLNIQPHFLDFFLLSIVTSGAFTIDSSASTLKINLTEHPICCTQQYLSNLATHWNNKIRQFFFLRNWNFIINRVFDQSGHLWTFCPYLMLELLLQIPEAGASSFSNFPVQFIL